MIFLVSLLSLLGVGAGYVAYVTFRRRKFLAKSWQDVLGRVEPVDLDGLQAIAYGFLQPDKNQLRIEPGEMWEIVGGLDGLHRLKKNAWAMLDLAVYAERWNLAKGPLISEMIRRDAVRLNRAIFRVQVGVLFQFGHLRSPFYLQEAVASYYLIRGRLVGLYQVAHIGLIPGLEAAV